MIDYDRHPPIDKYEEKCDHYRTRTVFVDGISILVCVDCGKELST